MKVFSFLAVLVGLFGKSTMTCHAADGLRGVKNTGMAAATTGTSNAVANKDPNTVDNHGRVLSDSVVPASFSPTCDVG